MGGVIALQSVHVPSDQRPYRMLYITFSFIVHAHAGAYCIEAVCSFRTSETSSSRKEKCVRDKSAAGLFLCCCVPRKWRNCAFIFYLPLVLVVGGAFACTVLILRVSLIILLAVTSEVLYYLELLES
jgi:hypothetical protein